MWYSKKYVKMLGNVMKPWRWIWIMNSSVTVSRKGILLCYAESLFVTLNVLPGADLSFGRFLFSASFSVFFLPDFKLLVIPFYFLKKLLE